MKREYAKWTFEIDFGLGFVPVYPYKNFEISIRRDGLNSIVNIDSLTFWEDKLETYSKIMTAAGSANSLPLKIYRNGVLFSTKELDIFSTSNDYKNKRIVCPVINSQNDLLQKILDSKDVEFNLLQNDIFSIDLDINTFTYFVIGISNGQSAPAGFEYWGQITQSDIPFWNSETSYDEYNGYSGQYPNIGSAGCLVKHVVGGLLRTYVSASDGNLNIEPSLISTDWIEYDFGSGVYAGKTIYYYTQKIGYTSFKNSFPFQFPQSKVEKVIFSVEGANFGGSLVASYPTQQNFDDALFYSTIDTNINTETTILSRGHKLFNIVNYIFTSIDSNILVEDTGGTNCWCNYLENSDYYNKIYMFANSDVKFPNATYPAQFVNVSLDAFLSFMYSVFGLEWYLNESNYLQFIHKSESDFFTGSINLQTVYKIDYSAANQKYVSKSNKEIRNETLKFMGSGDSQFEQVTVNYRAKGDSIEWNNGKFTTNIAELTKGENSSTNSEGLAVAVTDDVKVLELDFIANGYMKPEVIFLEHRKYDRPYPTGKIGGQTFTFLTTDSKEGGEVKCFGVDITNVSLNGLAITKLSDLVGAAGFRIREIRENIETGMQSFILEN